MHPANEQRQPRGNAEAGGHSRAHYCVDDEDATEQLQGEIGGKRLLLTLFHPVGEEQNEPCEEQAKAGVEEESHDTGKLGVHSRVEALGDVLPQRLPGGGLRKQAGRSLEHHPQELGAGQHDPAPQRERYGGGRGLLVGVCHSFFAASTA